MQGASPLRFRKPLLYALSNGARQEGTARPSWIHGRRQRHHRAHHLTHEAAARQPDDLPATKAGHSQTSITERYIHAAQTQHPGATERGEARLFAHAQPLPRES